MSNPLDIDRLEDERAEAQFEKTELFELYHKNWDTLIAELRAHREAKERRIRHKAEGLIS